MVCTYRKIRRTILDNCIISKDITTYVFTEIIDQEKGQGGGMGGLWKQSEKAD